MKLQKLVILFYIWLLAEGIFRKWIFPSYTDVIYFVKYIIIIVIFIRLRELRKQKTYYGEIKAPISVFVGFCMISLFYVSIINSPIVGVLGVLNYICFIPAAMALPYFLNTEEKIKKVVIIIALITIGISTLGIVQYYSPQDAQINRYATKEETSIATAGEIGSEVVRVTSVFSYHSGNGSYVLFTFILAISILFEKHKNALLRNLIYLSFGLSAIALFMTGSRTIVFLAMTILAGFMLAKSVYILNNAKILMGALLMTLLLSVAILYTEPGQKAFSSWNTRYQGGIENNEYSSRVDMLVNEIYDALFDLPYGLMGYGIGTYQNGAAKFNKILDKPGAEDEAHRVALELGPFGWFAWYIMILSTFFYTVRVYRFSRIPFLKNLSLIMSLYSFFGIVLYRQVVVNWLDNALWWTCLGLVISIRQVEVERRKPKIEKSKEYLNIIDTNANEFSR